MKFDNNGIPYNAPLSTAEKIQIPSGLLPSGEANYFDFKQSGINQLYPSPTGVVISGIFVPSGFFSSYPPDVNPIEKKSIFDYEGLVSSFSNVSQVSGLKIESFDIFNPYIHYYSSNNTPVKIPYVSTYRLSINFDPYKR